MNGHRSTNTLFSFFLFLKTQWGFCIKILHCNCESNVSQVHRCCILPLTLMVNFDRRYHLSNSASWVKTGWWGAVSPVSAHVKETLDFCILAIFSWITFLLTEWLLFFLKTLLGLCYVSMYPSNVFFFKRMSLFKQLMYIKYKWLQYSFKHFMLLGRWDNVIMCCRSGTD